MATKPNPLHLVDTARDVTKLLREEIEARDWSRVHIEGDRAAPLFLLPGVRRPWRA